MEMRWRFCYRGCKNTARYNIFLTVNYYHMMLTWHILSSCLCMSVSVCYEIVTFFV